MFHNNSGVLGLKISVPGNHTINEKSCFKQSFSMTYEENK